jgi:hypothetical protein
MGFLKSLFGPSKEEIWSQVANEINGDYIDGGFWEGDKLVYVHNEWEIVLDTYTTSSGTGKNRRTQSHTRMRVPFANKDGLYFELYRESIFSPIGKWLGGQDIIVGDSYFDDEFIVKGNQEAQVQLLLKDSRIKKLMSYLPSIHMSIKTGEGWFSNKYPDGVDELYFSCTGIMTSKEDLRNLFELFCLILTRMVKIDSAYEDDPELTL